MRNEIGLLSPWIIISKTTPALPAIILLGNSDSKD
jgi:hypothetical protein